MLKLGKASCCSKDKKAVSVKFLSQSIAYPAFTGASYENAFLSHHRLLSSVTLNKRKVKWMGMDVKSTDILQYWELSTCIYTYSSDHSFRPQYNTTNNKLD